MKQKNIVLLLLLFCLTGQKVYGVPFLPANINTMRKAVDVPIMEYGLKTEGFWQSISSAFTGSVDKYITKADLVGKYDELYWGAFDYRNLAKKSLDMAENALKSGNEMSFQKYMKKQDNILIYPNYLKTVLMTFFSETTTQQLIRYSKYTI